MKSGIAHSARREMALVIAVAACGVALVVAVAFAPWYEPVVAGNSGSVTVVHTYPAVAADLTATGAR